MATSFASIPPKNMKKSKLIDIDLEELEGLQVENSRFIKEHPEAKVWFDNPDWKAHKSK